MTVEVEPLPEATSGRHLEELLDQALGRLESARPFAKASYQGAVLDVARRLAALPGGVEALYQRIGRLEAAGIFAGSDWAHPETLQPILAANTLWYGDKQTAALEYLSEIRFLAVAGGDLLSTELTAEQAQHFLSQVLALNLNVLFGAATEAQRVRQSMPEAVVRNLYVYLAERIGYENILDRLIEEIWRILAQRPIQVDGVKAMIGQIAACMFNPEVDLGAAGRGADRLISALYGPTLGCREDPGLGVYAERLASMDANALAQEAGGFARAMYDTGLVSPYHPVFLRHIVERNEELLPQAFGLSSTGKDALLCYQGLVRSLIREAVHPETSQAVYGLALLLERGILYSPPIAPALWGQIALPLSTGNESVLTSVHGTAHPPRVFLLAGLLCVLGQPFGIGQGNNPTCQTARALSMWAYNDPDYLMQMLVWAARDEEVVMHFEGQALSSKAIAADTARLPPLDVDPVSLVLVPHLDRIYMEMGRRCADRGQDPHIWINPEFHGWWVGRGCRIAVDVASGKLSDYPDFVREFLAVYHPLYNGNRPLIHPQPAGIAVTDSQGRFVGWHAIAITRVALDQDGGMRVFFFNPNNDSGQDWGQGVRVSTHGRGERYGESSLPVEEFASRLYLFHFDTLEPRSPQAVPAELVTSIVERGRQSWGEKR
ncbi:hypothetical protein [Pelagibius marinus]|uniref:hypothetical protein n=1 Tax=Pelagibius marinus TaxID=2762760 RepID=UPI0018726879|nr:hypothetical protein [Pelagibius marinus]